MTLDQLLNVLVTITLVEMKAAIGLGVTFTDLTVVASAAWTAPSSPPTSCAAARGREPSFARVAALA